MQIHRGQLDTLRQVLELKYQRELAADFRRMHPESTTSLSDESLLSIIGTALARARSFGVASSTALLRYVSLAVLVSRDFDLTPEVRALFEAPGMNADYKVHLLSDIVIANLEQA